MTTPYVVLDHGEVKLIEKWGSEESIIEAARMSTNKGFIDWESDQKLLSYLYKNHHDTPFEMAGLVIEVKAPVFVFREWHRHRTQSYNEMSARYIPMPNEHYYPTKDRIIEGVSMSTSRQSNGTVPLNEGAIDAWLVALNSLYEASQAVYDAGLTVGVPKEIARLAVTVSRYSRMRASANLRNWLGFLTLRDATNAQWEIRQYAQAVSLILQEHFPRTMELHYAGR